MRPSGAAVCSASRGRPPNPPPLGTLAAPAPQVVVLKDGSRLELLGVEKYDDIKRHIESCIYD